MYFLFTHGQNLHQTVYMLILISSIINLFSLKKKCILVFILNNKKKKKIEIWFCDVYSHSVVPGGLDVKSYKTRVMPSIDEIARTILSMT